MCAHIIFNFIVSSNIMRNKFVDCFMLMNTAFSLRSGVKIKEMGRPTVPDLTPTFVNLSVNINELRIYENNYLQLELGGLLNQKWVDPRLGANSKTRKLATEGQIWKPNIVNIIGDLYECQTDETKFWRGFGVDGNVLLSEKIKLRVTCTSNYQHFPFDTQVCGVKFGSFRFPREEVTLHWSPSAVDISNSNHNSNEFVIENVTSFVEVDSRSSGNFSTGVIQFIIKRRPDYYIYHIILPCVFLTLINYLPLWFSLNHRSRRVYFNWSICGFLLYFYHVTACQIQVTHYLKAMDIFVLICVAFATITLLESLLVDVMCSSEECKFHLISASLEEYPKFVCRIEFAMKASYPVFYFFFVTLYGLLYC